MADNAAILAELEARWRQLSEERNALGDRYLNGEVDLLPTIKQMNAELKDIAIQIDALIVARSQTVAVETNLPLTSPDAVAGPATEETPNVDTGTDAPTKTFSQTQSTPAQTVEQVGTGAVSTSPGTPVATGTSGNGADDNNPQQATAESSTNSNSNSNSSTVGNSGGFGSGTGNNTFSIKPQPNILDQYASYTWSASLYLMSSEQYNQFVQSKKKSLTGYNLLIQSGGAPVNKTGFVGNLQTGVFYENNGVTSTTTADSGRSPAFPLDFYIDNISFTSRLNGKGTGQAHGAADLKFQVVEPNGITLLDRLYQAVQDSAPRNAGGPIDYTQARYLMVMRWYGFDENGNPIAPGKTAGVQLTDPNAIVEKFIPFSIKYVKFTVSNRLVTYDFDCAPIGQLVGGTSRRATVTSDVELTGKTVKDVLAGNAGTPVSRSATQADVRRVDNALENNAAPSVASGAPIIGSSSAVGLIQAMNSWQQELVKTGQRQYADTYEIVFAPGAEDIQNATVTLMEPVSNQSATPMGTAASKSPDSVLPDKQAVSYNGRNIAITAGTQMWYAIDYIIRNSSYISDQAAVGVSEENNPYINKDEASTKPVKWYNISIEAVQDGNKYDNKINAPVYKIRYIINAFTIQNFVSKFFPTVPWLGVHKSYPYWFTGDNVAVLDYQATFNNMYQLIVSGSTPGNNQANAILKTRSSSMRDQIKWYNAPRSTQSTAGAENRGNEIPAEAAEYLYDPGSLSEAKVRIIGDPAWIQQGVMLGTATVDSFDNPFLSDGTINFDGHQPMFEIAWQKPQDYDLNTGLADPYASRDRNPVQSYVYTGVSVTSEFKGGKFEQVLVGALYPFRKPDGLNAVQGSNAPQNASEATAQRTGVNLNSAAGAGRGYVNPEIVNPAPPGVNNDNGARPAPSDAEVTGSNTSYSGDQNGVQPADTVVAQASPEPPTSDGSDISVANYAAPPKLGDTGSTTADPSQYIVTEA